MPFQSVSRNPCKPYTPAPDDPADKTRVDQRLYLDLVKGIFLGKIQPFPAAPIEMPAGDNPPGDALADLVEEVIGEYGHLLEEVQENELRELARTRDIPGLRVRLREVAEREAARRRELIHATIGQVEALVRESAARSRTDPAPDPELARLRAQLAAGDDLAPTLRAITRQYNDALFCLAAAVYRAIGAEVMRNGGSAADADDVRSIVLVEFITKIERATYRWYDRNCLTKTFVVQIAKRRWVDELRRRTRRNETRLTDYDNP